MKLSKLHALVLFCVVFVAFIGQPAAQPDSMHWGGAWAALACSTKASQITPFATTALASLRSSDSNATSAHSVGLNLLK